VIIPNRDVYKNVILVHTHHSLHRLPFDVGIAYDNDADRATSAIVEALTGTAGVEHVPPPEALVHELGVSTVNIRAMLWTNSRRHESITVLDAAIKAVKARLDRDGIEMPANLVALQATPSFRAAIRGGPTLTPAGNLRPDPSDADEVRQ
jgi:small-conductance mechanosensitive channel